MAELRLVRAPPLGEFVRGILGLDVNAAKEAIAGFVSARTLTADQITFVNSLIDYLVVNGTVAREQLFETPSPSATTRGWPACSATSIR